MEPGAGGAAVPDVLHLFRRGAADINTRFRFVSVPLPGRRVRHGTFDGASWSTKAASCTRPSPASFQCQVFCFYQEFPMVGLSPEQLKAYLAKFAPEFHFHPDEKYFPSTVDAYLANVILYDKDNNKISVGEKGVTVEELKKPSADGGSYLEIAPGCEGIEKGSASNITVYCRAVEVPMPGPAVAYDLQYWVFYAQRGASTGRFGNALYDTVPFFLTPCGQHQGDWKVIKVRIDNTGSMLGVFFSAHTWGTWYALSAIGQKGGFEVTSTGAPVVYVACYSHSCFGQPDQTIVEATRGVLSAGVLHIDVIEQTGKGLSGQSTGLDLTDLGWLAFRGNWGPKEKQKLDTLPLQAAISNVVLAAPWLAPLIPLMGGLAATAMIFVEIFGDRLYTADAGGAATPANQIQWRSGEIMKFDGTFNIFRADEPGKLALGVRPNGGAGKPALLVQQTYDANEQSQRWTISAAFSDTAFFGLVLTNVGTNLCARWMPDDSIQMQPYMADPSFTWQPDCDINAHFWVFNKDFDSHVMDVSGGGNGTNQPVVIYKWHNAENQKFALKRLAS